MQIIKDRQLTENTWTFVDNDSPFSDGNISVTLNRWLSDKALLQQRSGGVGVRLASNDELGQLAADLSSIALIELDFSVFTDGRSFSQARLLRDQHGYQGEIRAVGKFMSDQVFYLSRVGVNAFEFAQAKEAELALAALNDFSVRYQVSTQ